jgi:hypothetical protein
MSTIIDSVRTSIKNNITPILFVGMILIIILSIYTNQRTTAAQIKELVEYADQTTPTILRSTVRIANESVISDNTPEAYQQTISDLTDLESYLVQRIDQIPEHPNDEDSTLLATLLTQYLDHVRGNVNALILQQQTLQSIQTELETVAQTSAIVESGDQTKLPKLINDARIVIDTIEPLSNLETIYPYITRVYLVHFESIELLSQLDATIASIEDVRSVIGEKIPSDKVLYPAIKRYQIEDQQYIDYIQQLQDQVQRLQTQHNL